MIRASLICPSCHFVATGDVDLNRKSPAYLSSSRSHKRGVSRSSRTLGAGCGGRERCSLTNERVMRTAKSCGPDAPMLASSLAEANASRGRRWQEGPVHRGEHDISRKTIAQGRPECSPLNLYARVRICFVHIAHETAGAARTRSSLRPCVQEIWQNVRTGGSRKTARCWN